MDINILTSRLNQENSDCQFYKDLAKQHPEYHKIFNDMAVEEHEHMQMIQHIIDHLQNK